VDTVADPAGGRRFTAPPTDWRLPLHTTEPDGRGAICTGTFGAATEPPKPRK
jgi:hypothetical protein